MEHTHLNFVIAGHVDHGKSTLIGRLLFDTGSIARAKVEEVKQICEALGRPFEFAFLMDHLEEERQKNITIDTAQTFFKTGKRDYVIIDAPGHKEFLKNMITGATLAEAAILIVDAFEGIQEQTKRHAYMLNLLGVSQLIVVINKMDKVGFLENRFEAVKSDLLNHLSRVSLTPNYIIPISARQGDNMARKSPNLDWYEGPTVLEALDSFQNKLADERLPLRLPIQDVYNALPVGQVESGILRKGQGVVILPDDVKSTVSEIKKWNQDLAEAHSGDNIGFVLAGDPEVKRGSVLCQSDQLPKVTSAFKATIFWMSSLPLKINEKFNLKLTTQETTAQIKKIHKLMDSSTLETIDRDSEIGETEVAEVDILAAKPLVVEDFNYLPHLGRFVIVRNDDIAAGGIITF